MIDDDDAEEIDWARENADDILQLAILHFLSMHEGQRGTFKLIGMQLALLRQSARLAMILKTETGARYTKTTFGSLARTEFVDVARMEFVDKSQTKKTKPKGPHLKVVK